MTVPELIPTIQRLSHTEKLLLLQVLVQELLNTEGAVQPTVPESAGVGAVYKQTSDWQDLMAGDIIEYYPP